MKKIRSRAALIGILVFGLAVAGTAYGLPWHEGHHHSAIMMWARHTLSPDQWKQVHSIIAAERTNLKSLHANARTSRLTLVGALLSGRDPAQAMNQLEQARAALLAERVKLARQVVAVLTPAQREQAQQFWSKWQTLLEQQRKERSQLLSSISTTPSSGPQQ